MTREIAPGRKKTTLSRKSHMIPPGCCLLPWGIISFFSGARGEKDIATDALLWVLKSHYRPQYQGSTLTVWHVYNGIRILTASGCCYLKCPCLRTADNRAVACLLMKIVNNLMAPIPADSLCGLADFDWSQYSNMLRRARRF